MFTRLKKRLEDESNISLSRTPPPILSDTPSSDDNASLPQEASPVQHSIRHDSTSSTISRRQSVDGLAESLEAYQASLSKKEKEWKTKLKKVLQEKHDLENKLQEAELRIQKLVDNHESKEELSNLQTQEMAKVKHLLLQREQELKSYEETVVRKQGELESAHRTIEELRTTLAKQPVSISAMTMLQKENEDLKVELDFLKKEALKANGLLEEKDALIINLNERLEILESRLKDQPSSIDEEVNALKAEREVLEKKLFEARHQLTEIKKTWSEKIHSLENQISHLTGKLVEDSTENSALSSQIKQLSTQLQEKEKYAWDLEDKLKASALQLKKMEDLKEEQFLEHQAAIQRLEVKHHEELALLKEQLSKAKSKITHLENCQTEQLEKELEVEKKLAQQENIISHLKAELREKEKECTTHNQRISSLSAMVLDLQNELKQAKEELKELPTLKALLQEEKELHLSATREKDELMLRNAELSQKVELAKQAAKQDSALAYKVEALESELLKANTKILEFTQNNENGNIKEFKKKVEDLESQIAEQNKIIKSDKRLIADLKKTLQKELKVQHYGSDDSATEDGGLHINPSSRSSQSIVPSEEEINFRYLKYVVFKFMTVPENEAQHLIKAVSTLLRFTAHEEKMIRQTLEARSSWFGMRTSSTT